MIIAVASGKGGTGKTTVATSLALSISQDSQTDHGALLFLDCDVEAPNAHLFLKPTFNQKQAVGILIPQVDESLCTHCGRCAEVCQYHAIAVLGKKTLVFPQLCHGCGNCTLICPEKAIRETLDVMGNLERGPTPSGIDFARGVLNIGEPMAVPVIRQLKNWTASKQERVVILDASPGTSCPVVEAMRGADFLLLVTEPTPFGLHDLKLAAQVARELQIPTGVVLNRCSDHSFQGGYLSIVESYCQEEGLPILLRIPFEREIAEGIAQGKTLVEIRPELIPRFVELFRRMSFERLSGIQASSSSVDMI
jgi:MinD superfamily P-loop ATPase